jgi:GNAT superfamily N-acetyltransferase
VETLMDVSIRRAGVEDVDLLFDIRTSVEQNAQTREELAARGITPDAVSVLLQTSCRAWIAECDGRPAGFAMANADEGCIFGLFVRPDFEGGGIGRRLMAEAEAFLFRDHDSVWLTTKVGEHLRAHGFYRKLGWLPAGLAETAGELRYEKTREFGSQSE